MKRILLLLALLLASHAYAGEPTSTAVTTDAKTILGLTPANSATVDATNAPETLTQNAATTIPTSAFSCGAGVVLTSNSAVTATLPAIAGSQPLAVGCWIDVIYVGTASVTLNTCPVNTCGESAGLFDTINGTSLTTVTLVQNSNGVRFEVFPNGTGSGVFYTVGLPNPYLGTIKGYLGTARTVTTATTFAQTDCGTTINYNSGSNVNFTLPSNVVGFCPINVKQMSTGVVTFVNNGTSTFLANINGYTKTGGLNTMVTMENSTGDALWALQGQGQ